MGDYNTKCASGDSTPQPHNYPKADSWCATLHNNTDCWASPDGPGTTEDCYTTEDPSNNFIAIRRFEDGKGTLYAEFQSGNLDDKPVDFSQIDFVEHYHVSVDPHQMHNLASDPAGNDDRKELHKRLHQWLTCAGASCLPVAID